LPRPLYRRGNISPYSLDRRLDGSQRSSERGAEKKYRLRLPFLRSSNPWRGHQTDEAARIVELHRVSFFAVKWKTFRSFGVPYRCVLYTPDYFRYKEGFYCACRTASVISRLYSTHPSTSVTKYVAPQIKQNTIAEHLCRHSDTKRDARRLEGVQPLYGARSLCTSLR